MVILVIATVLAIRLPSLRKAKTLASRSTC